MKRTIEISSRDIRLSLKEQRLVLQREEEVIARIPIEDIGVVVLDSTGISISSGALKALADAGSALLACDDSHHPNGIFLPIAANTLHGERVQLQARMSEPLRKSLWAYIIRCKILNQADAAPGVAQQRLLHLAASVKSGDTSNCESQAARVYWSSFFDDIPGIEKPFLRHRDGPCPNHMLNYGYAIIRASIARAICAAGLHPALGIFHRNRTNGFSLVDDIMEPYRPIVDLRVHQLVRAGSRQIDKEVKSRLIAILSDQIEIGGESCSISLAAERTASSLAKCITAYVKEGIQTQQASFMLQLPALGGGSRR